MGAQIYGKRNYPIKNLQTLTLDKVFVVLNGMLVGHICLSESCDFVINNQLHAISSQKI